MADVLETLRLRYGDSELLETPLGRLIAKQNRNRARREAIGAHIAELEEERRRLAEEGRRMELMEQELVSEVAERIRERKGEAWSPTPVIGYRVWEVLDDGLAGATGFRWGEPAMAATCRQSRPRDDLPHTDHLCSAVGHGCGIYAVRHPSLLSGVAGGDAVVGVVLMSGKVVEHEHGYRAAHARVAAVAAHALGRFLVTSSVETIRALFAHPRRTLERRGEARGKLQDESELLEAIQGLEREMEPWT